MSKSIWSLLLLLLLLAGTLFGQLPGFYKSVDRVVWVVENLDSTLEGMKKLGFTNVQHVGQVTLSDVQFRGEAASGSLRMASGRFADVPVHWVQPLSGSNAFTEFETRHRSGVFSLVHRVPSAAAFDGELQRMRGLGVEVLQQGALDTDAGTIRYAFLDTEREGKYVLGLIYYPGLIEEGPIGIPPGNPTGPKVVQYAFTVQYLMPVSLYWSRLGWPPMSVTRSKLWGLRYRDQPGEFEMELGWQRHGEVPYEWVRSLKGPDIYIDHMREHGEGFHHFAFQVDDIDRETAHWNELGFPFVMGGGWGEEGKPGSGRFAYHDLHAIGGIDVELLWSFRKQ